MGNKHTSDAVVVGGGVIGLAAARELAGAGLRVTLVERGRLAGEASHAAAGMLAPQAEADAPDRFFEVARVSRRMFPEFVAGLREETNVDAELDEAGVICPAFTEEDAAELERRFAWQRRDNLAVERLAPADALRMEPALSHRLRLALRFPEDAQVENRKLTHALVASCARRGVEMLTHTEVISIRTDEGGGRVRGVVTTRGRIETNTVIVAAGAWASRLWSQHRVAATHPRIEPVRGQMVCLEAAPPIVRHVIYGSRAYLVPRRDGRLLVGATVEHVGFDRSVTACGVSALTAGAIEICPRVGDLPFVDAWAGLRPRGTDELPVVGRATEIDGLFFAAGHYRNGILLAPLTARVLRELVTAPDHAHVPNPFAPDHAPDASRIQLLPRVAAT